MILIIQIACNFVMGFFISYYIIKFSNDNSTSAIQESKDGRTPSLEREQVPNLVYMQNQKALTQFIHSELKDKADNKKLLVLQTQTNLYINALWQDVCAEEEDHASASSILTTFVDFNKSSSVLLSSSPDFQSIAENVRNSNR